MLPVTTEQLQSVFYTARSSHKVTSVPSVSLRKPHPKAVTTRTSSNYHRKLDKGSLEQPATNHSAAQERELLRVRTERTSAQCGSEKAFRPWKGQARLHGNSQSETRTNVECVTSTRTSARDGNCPRTHSEAAGSVKRSLWQA